MNVCKTRGDINAKVSSTSSEARPQKQKLNQVARQVGLEIDSAGLRHSDDTWRTNLVSATLPWKRCAGTLKNGVGGERLRCLSVRVDRDVWSCLHEGKSETS